jgi:hypothetical protein
MKPTAGKWVSPLAVAPGRATAARLPSTEKAQTVLL